MKVRLARLQRLPKPLYLYFTVPCHCPLSLKYVGVFSQIHPKNCLQNHKQWLWWMSEYRYVRVAASTDDSISCRFDIDQVMQMLESHQRHQMEGNWGRSASSRHWQSLLRLWSPQSSSLLPEKKMKKKIRIMIIIIIIIIMTMMCQF